MESLKFPTTAGLSPGVGLRKQGLLALQMMPCTQGRVPAEGIALLGKWPGKSNVKSIRLLLKHQKNVGEVRKTSLDLEGDLGYLSVLQNR